MMFETELMKASTEIENGASYRVVTKYDVNALHGFYRSLDATQRRARFGAAVSDNSIDCYCEQIDWRSTIVIARINAGSLDAAATNVRIDTARVENATVANASGEGASRTLLRLSAIATREFFAANQLLVDLEGTSELLHWLREIGPVTIVDAVAVLDVRAVLTLTTLLGSPYARVRSEKHVLPSHTELAARPLLSHRAD